jgi:hypothetical protein
LLFLSTSHFPSLHFAIPIYISLPFTSLCYSYLHLTSLHFTLLFLSTSHFPSLHFPSLFTFNRPHFPSLVFTFLTLVLKIRVLPWEVPIVPSGSRFQSVMDLFTNDYFPMSVLCFLALIFQWWSTLLMQLGACSLYLYVYQISTVCIFVSGSEESGIHVYFFIIVQRPHIRYNMIWYRSTVKTQLLFINTLLCTINFTTTCFGPFIGPSSGCI